MPTLLWEQTTAGHGRFLVPEQLAADRVLCARHRERKGNALVHRRHGEGRKFEPGSGGGGLAQQKSLTTRGFDRQGPSGSLPQAYDFIGRPIDGSRFGAGRILGGFENGFDLASTDQLRKPAIVRMLEPPAARGNSRMNSGFLGRIDDLVRAAVLDDLLSNRGRDKGIARERVRLGFDGFGAGYVEIVEYQLKHDGHVSSYLAAEGAHLGHLFTPKLDNDLAKPLTQLFLSALTGA